jgi:hypothetical protein
VIFDKKTFFCFTGGSLFVVSNNNNKMSKPLLSPKKRKRTNRVIDFKVEKYTDEKNVCYLRIFNVALPCPLSSSSETLKNAFENIVTRLKSIHWSIDELENGNFEHREGENLIEYAVFEVPYFVDESEKNKELIDFVEANRRIDMNFEKVQSSEKFKSCEKYKYYRSTVSEWAFWIFCTALHQAGFTYSRVATTGDMVRAVFTIPIEGQAPMGRASPTTFTSAKKRSKKLRDAESGEDPLFFSTSVAGAIGDRRVFVSKSNVDYFRSPITNFANDKGVFFDAKSIIRVRNACVFSEIVNEVAGIAVWDDTTNSFALSAENLVIGENTSADAAYFYVEFHTHPLGSIVRTGRIINVPSTADFSSVVEQYRDGIVLSLVLTPNGVFSIHLMSYIQKAICFSGHADGFPSFGGKALFDFIRNGINAYNIADEIGRDIYGDKIGTDDPERVECLSRVNVGGASCHINEDKEVKCTDVDGSVGILWCLYKWCKNQDICSEQFATSMSTAVTLRYIYDQAISASPNDSELISHVFEIAIATLVESSEGLFDAESAESLPIFKTEFIPWRKIDEAEKLKKSIPLAQPTCFYNWVPPADRFSKNINPRIDEESRAKNENVPLPIDADKFGFERTCTYFHGPVYKAVVLKTRNAISKTNRFKSTLFTEPDASKDTSGITNMIDENDTYVDPIFTGNLPVQYGNAADMDRYLHSTVREITPSDHRDTAVTALDIRSEKVKKHKRRKIKKKAKLRN